MYRKTFIISLVVIISILSLSTLIFSEENKEIKTMLNSDQYIPDIATFMQIGGNSPAGYSWDGKDVFFRSSMSGASQIYRITENNWPYQLTTFEDGIDFFVNSNYSNIAVIGASTGGSEQSQLYLMNTQSGQIAPLTDAANIQYGSVSFSPDDAFVYFRSNEENGRDFFIYKLDVSNGEYNKIFGDTTGVRGYNAIGDISQDGTKMIILNFTSNVNNDIFILDLNSLEYQQINDDDKDVSYYSTSLMPDNKTIWLTCNDNSDGISRIATMNVGSPKVNYVNDGWIDPKWEIEGLGFSKDFKYMSATYNENGYVHLKLREFESKKELPSPPLDGILGGGNFAKDGSCIVSFTSPTNAPDVWKWNPNTQELKQLTFSIYAGIDRSIFNEPKLISYKSFDGLEIPAFLYLPPNYKEGEKIPFLVHAHGGPESQYQPYFIRNVQYLMLNGFGILAPNPRGSSGYGREYLNLDNYKNRKNSLKDYKAGVEWLIEKGYTEKGKLAIRGGSYGGYVVLGMITEYPNLFSAAIDIVGIANFKTFLENTKAYRRALRESEYGPLSDPDFLESVSPLNKAHLIKTPLLVIHGENDPRVPVSEARQILKAVIDNGGIADSLIFPDEGHGTSKRPNVITSYRTQVKFLNEHLK